jgi:amino acid transporter
VTIRTRLGLAIAAGVPVLVLVSMGPVAGLAGTPSVLVWAASAVIGFFMALAFAELAWSLPAQTGGVGVLAAQVLASRSRALAVVTQWSYWFGWSPALAINGILAGNYLQVILLPRAPSWTAVGFATAILAGSVTINHFGMRHGARFQALLAACVLAAVAALTAGALLRGQFDGGRLLPFAPPGGWASSHGLMAIAGGLFIAGWSAYGAELALSYGTEYSGGARDAVKALVAIAVASVAAYSVVPFLLIGVLGTARIQDDPAVALTPLAQHAAGSAAAVVVALLIVALLLGLNMVTIGSSRTLYQMARNGDAWAFLGRRNRHGVPSNALRFDMAVNVLLLLVILVLNRGRSSGAPIALLAAANVGYFLSISLALVAAWLNHRDPRSRHRPLRIRDGLMHLTLVLAAFNLGLLACAGFGWGWSDLALGVVVLGGVIVVFTHGRRHTGARAGLRSQPTCMAWGADPMTARLEDLMALRPTLEVSPNHGEASSGLGRANREPGTPAVDRS